MGYRHIANLYRAEAQHILLFRECFALEKVHGTSAHISWNDGQLTFFSGEQHANFVKLFDAEALKAVFLEMGHPKITIFGEAHGGKIQKQSWRYGSELKFVAFDVHSGDEWLSVPVAHRIVERLGLEFVHYVRCSTDLTALDAERDAPSEQAKRNGVEGVHRREGVVLRPIFECDFQGERVMAKHKRPEERETATTRNVEDPAKLQVLKDAEAIAHEWVTQTRLEHVLAKISEDPQLSDTRRVIDAMLEDVRREGAGEFVDSDEVTRAISAATAKIFKRNVMKVTA